MHCLRFVQSSQRKGESNNRKHAVVFRRTRWSRRNTKHFRRKERSIHDSVMRWVSSIGIGKQYNVFIPPAIKAPRLGMGLKGWNNTAQLCRSNNRQLQDSRMANFKNYRVYILAAVAYLGSVLFGIILSPPLPFAPKLAICTKTILR